MADSEIKRLALVYEWPEVRGLQVVVTEATERPQSVTLAIMGTDDGWSDVAMIDRSDAGARARAISLGEIIHDALEAAEMTWFPCDIAA
ncbi:hypothetical protein FV232_25525 [Methylobacterium sp. WL30]|uniref:hypothetical protein n=1 Tax=unclassified Methylobacterium TaxID=2615210 RepID=UPI0011CBCC67|nr:MULTISPECIES: hypothetical protein [unclassified Methylobacterium]TXN41795.1 hypothetical protein FV225_00920 [Methylobacterium sp. WL93]TXN51891.1 hypothetical protein FV227_06025 [Methylobacterium sp. WL119]TXN62395.1 hypothetical protein FV232_25525 [Methylobacterium sp. WL30]